MDLPLPDDPANRIVSRRGTRNSGSASSASSGAASSTRWRVAIPSSSARSSASICSISSATPAPRAPRVVQVAACLSAGRALATATEIPHSARNALSFSASPTPTQFRGESFISASAAAKPEALFTPAGSTMTAPLLKMICSSRPSSWIASRTSVSFGSHVATITRPTESG